MNRKKQMSKGIEEKKEKNKQKRDEKLDKELKDTFPASDATAKY